MRANFTPSTPEFWLTYSKKTHGNTDLIFKTAYQLKAGSPVDCEIANKLMGNRISKSEKLMNVLKTIIVSLIESLDELLQHINKRSDELNRNLAEMNLSIHSRLNILV